MKVKNTYNFQSETLSGGPNLGTQGRGQDNMQLAFMEVNCDGGIGFLWLIIVPIRIILRFYGFRYRLSDCKVFKDGYLPCNGLGFVKLPGK